MAATNRAPGTRSATRRADGFTLVELLVVIGVLVVLVSILIPMVTKARAKGQEVKCATNLRAWGQAFMAYAAMYDGTIPHYGDYTFNPNPFGQSDQDDPAYPINRCGYTDVLPPLMGLKPWDSYPAGQRPKTGIWQCPVAEVLDDSAYGYWASNFGYHSYVMNQYLEADNPGLVRRNAPEKSLPLQASFLDLSRAQWSSVTLLMYETTLMPDQAYGPGATPSSCYCGYRPADSGGTIAYFHPHQPNSPGVNTLMLDGHVEWTDTLRDPTVNNGSWLPATTDHRWWPYAIAAPATKS